MSKTAHFIAGHPLRIGGALGMHKAKEKGGKDGERVFVFKVDEKEYYVSNKIEDDKNGTQEEDSYRGLFGAGYDFTYHQKKWDKIQKDFLEKRVKVLTDLNIDEEEARSFIGKAACGYYAGQEIAGHSSDTDQMYNEFNKLFGSDENQKKALDSFQKLQDHIDIPGIENLRFVHLCSHVANPVQAGLSPDKEGDLKKHFTGLFYKDIKQGDFVDAVKKTIKTAIEKLKEDGFKAINTTTPGDGVFKNPVWPYLGRDIWNDINIKTEGFEYKIQRCSSGNTAKEIVKEFVAQQEKLALEAAEAARKVEEEERLAAEAEEAAKKAEAERLAAEAAEAAKKAEAERLAAEAPEASEAAKKAEEAPEAPEAAEAAEAASSSIGETQTVENRRASLIAKQEEAYKAVKKDPTKLEEYLNPESYVGWGAKIKRSREGVYEITNVAEGGFAAAIDLKVGQKIIINTEELKKDGDVDLMITLAYNLRKGDLTGVTSIGDYNISEQSNRNKISNLYKENQRIFNKKDSCYELDGFESPVKIEQLVEVKRAEIEGKPRSDGRTSKQIENIKGGEWMVDSDLNYFSKVFDVRFSIILNDDILNDERFNLHFGNGKSPDIKLKMDSEAGKKADSGIHYNYITKDEETKEVPGDGSCGFHAILAGLYELDNGKKAQIKKIQIDSKELNLGLSLCDVNEHNIEHMNNVKLLRNFLYKEIIKEKPSPSPSTSTSSPSPSSAR